jgi:phage shock protein A
MDAKPEENKSKDEGIIGKIGNILSGGERAETKPEEPKSKRDGILDKIQNFITSGYGKKEDLRELDKALREQYYSELMALRHRWEKVYLEALEAGQSPIGRECKKVIQTMDRLSATVNRANYGYAPLFDRVDKIQEQALNRVLEYDKTLAGNLTQIDKEVEAAEASVSELNWSQLRTNINTLKKSLTAFDEGWRNRKQAMSG